MPISPGRVMVIIQTFLGILFFFLFGWQVQAQSTPPFASFVPENISIVSHYPESAFVRNRLLPFTIAGGEDIRITSARVTRGESCVAMADPFHNRVFHLHCRNPELLVAEVMFSSGFRENLIFIVGPFQIFEERMPSEDGL